MIDSRELRLGNLIYGPSDREETIVAIIGEGWVKLYPGRLTGARFDAELKDCSGIPLTEEWLIKLGFEEVYRSLYTVRYENLQQAQFDYRFNLVENLRHLTWRGNTVQCEYVHQLQNLYYSLTGQELQLTQ
jgi:hypothetical protein